MPANRFNGHTNYGIGIGLRIPHYQHILTRKPVVDWFEIISENYMIDGGRPLAILDRILEQYRVVQHGVSMYFGSAGPAESRTPEEAESAGPQNQNSVADRSPVLGKRGRPLYARSAANALHLGSGEIDGEEGAAGAGLCRRFRSRSKT